MVSFFSDQHNYKTSSFTQGNLINFFYKTKRYGKYSITVSAGESWNKIQKQLKDMLLKNLSLNKVQTIVSDFYLKPFWITHWSCKSYIASYDFISS